MPKSSTMPTIYRKEPVSVCCLTLFTIAFTCLFFACKKSDKDFLSAEKENSSVAIDWYKLQLRIMLHANPATNNAANSSNFGYIGTALYEAVRPGIKRSVSLSTKLYQMPAMPAAETNMDYLWTASANAALASLVRSLYTGLTDANKTSIDSMENAYNQRLKSQTTDEIFTRSQAYGRQIASAIYNWSKTDGLNISNVGYIPPVFAGAWEATPPAFSGAASPFAKDARPFMEWSLTATAPPFPHPYSEDPTSAFYKMVKEVYDASKVLTPEQQAMALWWADVGVGRGYTPPGHYMNIVTLALGSNNMNLAEAAVVYAKSGIALRDAFITLWKMKFQYNLVRPVTFIRKTMDPTWMPLIGTPAHPEYPAAHAYLTNAVMQVLTRELGANVPVTDDSYAFLGYAPRHYLSFTKVAEEASLSRFYAGIHYKPSLDLGLSLGKQVGDKAADIQLTP
jgi:hypothetical protein